MSSNGMARIAPLGTLLLLAAFAILFLAMMDAGSDLPVGLPETWYTFRYMWYLLGLVLFWGGCILLKKSSEPTEVDMWSPRKSGQRFHSLRLYTRQNCHLCDETKMLLMAYISFLPPIDEIDIDQNPEYLKQFTTCVPVVEIDGKVRFRGQVNEALLRRLIEGESPSE